MSTNLPGISPRNYIGTRATRPPQQFFKDRAPLTTDNSASEFSIGDEWLDKSASPAEFYKLVSNANHVAVWVSLTAAGTGTVSGLTVDSFFGPGTNPVLPTGGGLIKATGGQVAAGTIGANTIRTNSLAANTYTTQIQRSSASLLANLNLNGVSHFDASDFSVDPNGFVSLVGVAPVTTPITAFYAYLSATQLNVTGNGTNFIIPYNTTIYNVNTAFNTATNRFVAQETGVHRFVSAVDLEGVLNTHTSYEVNLIVAGVSAGTYLMIRQTAAGERTSINDMTINSSIEVFMTAGDTARIQITVAGGALVVDVEGGTSTQSGYFAGAFVSAVALPGTVTWKRISASQTLVINEGYFCVTAPPPAAISLALPTLASIGDIIEIALQGATSWTVTQGVGQQIFIGIGSTTLGVGGSLASTAQGNTIRMICSQTNSTWQVVSMIGNITVV